MPSRGRGNQTASNRHISRRRVLRAGVMSGALALAGCSGDGSDQETTGGDDTEGQETTTGEFEPRSNTFVEPITVNPTNYQFNHLNLTNPFAHAMQNDWFQRYNFAKEEIASYAVSVEEYSGEKAVLKVRDGLTWHNGDPGDPVNADDLYTKLVTDAITGGTISTLWTDIQRAGDKSVELTLQGTVNEALFMDAMNYYAFETPYRMYKDYVERWEDATTDDEVGKIMSDIRNDAFDEPKGFGPFQFEERSGNHLRMSKYEHHPDAANINWDYWELQRKSTDTASVLLGMEVDGIRNYTAPDSVFKQKPDALKAAYIPAVWGQSLPFNHNDDDFGDMRVRQAIAEFVDREACANNYGRFGQPVQAPSGLVGNIDGQNEQTDRWKNRVSDEMAKQLHRYDDPERGRQLLRDAGYQKDDGTWYRPNGDPLEIPIKVPAGYSDWHPIYQTIVSNLNQEGINASMVTIEASAYWADHYLSGNFKAASTGWTLQRGSLYYTSDMYYNVDPEFMNLKPGELEAPPVGELDGELQSVDPRGVMDELLVAQDEAKAQELRDELAWITNQTLPLLPIQEINDPCWFNTQDFQIPSTDEEVFQAKFPLWWLPRMGELQAKPAK